jgi:predicted transcriptional regulator
MGQNKFNEFKSNEPKSNNLGLSQLLQKLNELYDREEQLIKAFRQLQEDKELLQLMIMHQYNKNDRMRLTK